MKTKNIKLICLILAICLALSAFAGCKKSNEQVTSSEPTVSSQDSDTDNTSSEDTAENPDEDTAENPDEDTDDWDDWDDYDDGDDTDDNGNNDNQSDLEEIPNQDNDDWKDEEVFYNDFYVNNGTVINNNFRGIGYIHQMASYQKDSFGRLYTDAQREHELEIFKTMGVKNIRAFYGSAYTYNAKTGEQEYDSQRMKDFATACKAMDSIGVDVGVTAIWTMKPLVENKEDKSTGAMNLGCPGIVVKDDWDATLRNYRDFMKNSVLAFKALGIKNVKYFFAYTECNNTFTEDGLDINGNKAENICANREYDRIYPLFDDLITALDGGLKDAGVRKNYKIVGPCDNWRADDGSEEEYSHLVRYTIKNLADKVDIIGSHNTYDRAKEFTDDMFYERPIDKLTSCMNDAHSVDKEYWVDEYNVHADGYGSGYENVRLMKANPWMGVAAGAMVNSLMNMGGVNNVYLWTLWDEQWPDNTNAKLNGEFDNGIQICGYLPCLFETETPRAAWYSVSLLTKYVGSGKVFKTTDSFGETLDIYETYISAIERDDGETTVVMTNYAVEDVSVKIHFDKSMKGKTFYRYVYNPNTIEPVASCEMISANGVAKNVTEGFMDTLIAGTVTIYSTEKPANVK